MNKDNTQYTTIKSEYAEVTSVNHPLTKARGFSQVTPGEMVIFDDQSLGKILSFNKDEIQIMSFSKTPVKIKSKLYRTNAQLSFPITDNIFGNIHSPLGEILLRSKKNSKPSKTHYAEIYSIPPKISQRKKILKQMITGFSITDLLLPIGHGQRELLIGDRKSGKSNFARNLSLEQAKKGAKIVYAMIAKKVSDIKKAYDFFEKNKVIDDVVIIATTPKDSVSSIITTPYSAMTVAEHLTSKGDNVLLILDDLSSHAEFYRELSLLAKKFPGRDSYPGDIFFSHAQLLERAGSFASPKNEAETVSITCLPIVRTTSSDLTNFIASNLISITDGHLLFDSHLFNQGIRPAIDFSLSVTRVGKQTQSQLQRDVNLKITSFLSTYHKTKNLTHLGSEISKTSQEILRKGQLLTDFFSESKGISLNIQFILIAMIWLGWFEQTHKNVLSSCKFELNSKSKDKKISTQLKDITDKANTFNELLEAVKNNKIFLLGLCQI